MALDLTDATARHDNPNSKNHKRDKEEKAERIRTEWQATPALAREAGSKVLDGCYASPVNGFCFWIKDGCAQRATDDAEYTRAAIAMSKERARYVRVRIRNGKERKDVGEYRHGAVSLVVTVAPWQVPTMRRLPQERRESLLLHLAGVQATAITAVSGRIPYGGGIHEDTQLDHWHHHVPKRPAPPESLPYPKSSFLQAGPWTVGACRINDKFPGLLTQHKKEMLERNLAKKDVPHLVDLACARASDLALEEWLKERGLLKAYQADCREYFRRKEKIQKEEKYRRIMQVALDRYIEDGVWPLAWQIMKKEMYRMLPSELKAGIMLSIRANQIIKRPVKTLTRMAFCKIENEIIQPMVSKKGT